MINAARTLLLNVSGTTVDLTQPLAEYVPVEFTRLQTPTWLTAVRNKLFSGNLSVAQTNVRVQQYMQLLHAGLYADHLSALDPRFTYLPFQTDTLAVATTIPALNIGQVVQQLSQLVHDDYPIFRTTAEPYLTCRNLWTKHTLGAYRLTGLLLAVIYCMQDIQQGVLFDGN